MYGTIDYYRSLSETKTVRRGEIWWTCFAYSRLGNEVLRLRSEQKVTLIDVRAFDPQLEQDEPKNRTKAGEFMALVKYKVRPVIIVSSAATASRHDAKRPSGDRYLVVPLCTLRDDLTGEYKHRPEFVWDAITYQCPCVYYLPEASEYGARESVARIDDMTTLHASWLQTSARCCLTDEALKCLDEWIRHFLHGKVRDSFWRDIQDYREMAGSDPSFRIGILGS